MSTTVLGARSGSYAWRSRVKKRHLKKRGVDSPARGAEFGVVSVAVMVAFAVVGAFGSGYLAHVHEQLRVDPTWQSVCDVSPRVSCSVVASSRFGVLLGAPLSTYAIPFYVFVGVLALLPRRWNRPDSTRSLAGLLTLAGLLSSLLSIGLAALSLVSVHAICPLCVLLYFINFGILLVAARILRTTGEGVVAALRRLRRDWRTHSEWLLVPILVGGSALLLIALVFARPHEPGACGQLGVAFGNRAPGPLAVTAYDDFQCPPCRASDQILRRFRGEEGLTVVHRQYPLDNVCNQNITRAFHVGACLQARAAICAHTFERYDTYSDRLFDEGPVDEPALVALADAVGIERTSFAACLRSDATAGALDADLAAGRADGVTATPTFVVDGKRYVGELRADELACQLGR